MVNYQLRSNLMTLTACLYQPDAEWQFTKDTLWNFLLDCDWQLRNGEPVRRVPFFVTASPVEADRAIDDMKKALKALRKGNATDEPPAVSEKQNSGKSWGFTGKTDTPRRRTSQKA